MTLAGKVSPADLGELRCSDLDVPLFTSEHFDGEFTPYLCELTGEKLLARNSCDSETIALLANLWEQIVELITCFVLDVVAPNVRQESRALSDSSRSSVTTSSLDGQQKKRNFHNVTDDDILASLGNSLHLSFGSTLGVDVAKSETFDRIVEMVAAEVAKRVNNSLACKRGSAASSSAAAVLGEALSLEELAFHTAHVLKSVMRSEPPEDGRAGAETDADNSLGSRSTAALSQTEDDFLPAFLRKLLHSIIRSIHTLQLDFDWMLWYLRHTTAGKINPALSQSADLHLSIFALLCEEFGSGLQVYTAMLADKAPFVEAVARALLRTQRLDSSRRSASRASRSSRGSLLTEAKAFFRRRTSEVAPACGGSARRGEERAVVRWTGRRALASLLRALKTSFACCVCQD